MNLIEHKSRDDMKVWLSGEELDRLIDQPDDNEHEIAFALAGRCGLRSHEVLQVTPNDVNETDVGMMLSVPEGKGEKYRETPIPNALATKVLKQSLDHGDSEAPVVSVDSTRALRQWIQDAREALAARDDERDQWRHVTMHDLRRTWATQLSNEEVDPLVVCQWGGWNDLDTFLDHYQGAFSPEAQKRERSKVDWL